MRVSIAIISAVFISDSEALRLLKSYGVRDFEGEAVSRVPNFKSLLLDEGGLIGKVVRGSAMVIGEVGGTGVRKAVMKIEF